MIINPIKYNIHQAKAKFSELLHRAEKVERVILCRRNVPIAEICALKPQGKKRRKIGVARGLIQIAENFNAPLPDDVAESFYSGRIKPDYYPHLSR